MAANPKGMAAGLSPAADVHRQALNIVQQRLLDARQLETEYRNVVMRDHTIDHTVEQSQQPENSPRNRYGNVLPYDYNRVKLSSSPGYVNASHVRYADSPSDVQCDYIATQGPLSGTVEEFWCMCLEKGCTAVVMLTNLVERGMKKCALYFPAKVGEVISTPKIEVRTVALTITAHNELTIRKMEVTGSVGTQRKTLMVNHYHYHAWPDHGTPEESLAIRSMCDALPGQRGNGEPVVVHCSAGIGRTGTFIIIDIVRMRLRKLSQVAKAGGHVPPEAVQQALAIPDLVHQLRQQRMGMVQTAEQYVFIYHALREELAELAGRGAPPS